MSGFLRPSLGHSGVGFYCPFFSPRSWCGLPASPLCAHRVHYCHVGLPRWLSGRVHLSSRRCKRLRFDPWVRKIPWSRKWQHTLVFLPGKFHGQRSLVGYSPGGCKESDMTEQSTAFWCWQFLPLWATSSLWSPFHPMIKNQVLTVFNSQLPFVGLFLKKNYFDFEKILYSGK